MTAKHTTGPWELSKTEIYIGPKLIASAWYPRKMPVESDTRNEGESWLDWMTRTQPERDLIELEQMANARLISAAPELLDSLKSIMASIPDIAEFEDANGNSMKPLVEKAKAAISKAEGENQ